MKGVKGFQKGIHYDTSFKPGKAHPLWKGAKVGYSALHEWIAVHWGKAREYLCKCGKQALDWANLRGKYTRDRREWEPMCRSCHKKYDKADPKKARVAMAKKRAAMNV